MAANWRSLSVSALNPSTLISAVQGIITIQNTLNTIKTAASNKTALLKDISAVIIPQFSAAGPIRDTLVGLINSIETAAINFAQITPAQGSYNYLQLQTAGLLGATWDPDYPNFPASSSAFLVGFYISQSFDACAQAFQSLKGLFSAGSVPDVATAQVQPVEKAPDPTTGLGVASQFVPNWTQEQVFRSGAENIGPWTSQVITDLIPGGRSLLDHAREIIEGMTVSDPLSPIQTFLAEQQAQLTTIANDITAINNLITALQAFFTNDQISVLTIDPVTGGTAGLIGAVNSAFSSATPSYPGSRGVPAQTGAGVIVVGGGPSAVVNTAYTTLKTLFGL